MVNRFEKGEMEMDFLTEINSLPEVEKIKDYGCGEYDVFIKDDVLFIVEMFGHVKWMDFGHTTIVGSIENLKDLIKKLADKDTSDQWVFDYMMSNGSITDSLIEYMVKNKNVKVKEKV